MKHLLLPAIILLVATSSCRKACDFIHDHPDAHDNICRVTTITFGTFQAGISPPGSLQVGITYNKKGNPTDMLVLNAWVPFYTTEQHFRYDRFERLTDYIVNGRGGEPTPASGPLRGPSIIWHKYAYPHPDIVADTQLNYTNSPIDGPPPIADEGQLVSLYKFNAAGKMIATAQTFNLPQQPPPTFVPIAYDARGNKDLSIYTKIVYDSAVSVYRTNKVWQFVYQDYSRNNPVYVGAYPTFKPTPTNQFGLPTLLPIIANGPVPRFNIGASADLGNAYAIEYACSMPKGPVGY